MSFPSMDELLARAVDEHKQQADEIERLRDIIDRARNEGLNGCRTEKMVLILDEVDQKGAR